MVTERSALGQAESVAIDSLLDDRGRLELALHLLWISGKRERAAALLSELLQRDQGEGLSRARGALTLAELAELSGDRRHAVSLLERARVLAGAKSAVGREAEDRRMRIISEAPLAEVRGPVPGTVKLPDSPAVVAAFRRAERLLAAFHRIVLNPRLETMDSLRAVKRRALVQAVAAYGQVIERGEDVAKAASLFRIAAMHHHMAESLAFEQPPELLPKVAWALRRELGKESAVQLKRALAHYQQVAALRSPLAGVVYWQSLAARQAALLGRVVAGKSRGH